MKKCSSLLAAMLIAVTAVSAPFSTVAESDSYDMKVTVDLAGTTKEISPLIYSVNQYGNEDIFDELNVSGIRQGGNRMTAYNWETNASNAGSDWKHSSDDNLSKSDRPADCVQVLSEMSAKNNIGYKLATLQMAGYVSADKNGTVTEEEAAPSDRWNEVKFTKGSAFSDEPDLTDGVVYMDEYVNYIVNKLGDASSETGIQAYSLDNEPALWSHTHSRMHADPTGCEELTSKSIELAKAVKAVDPKAEIFGPALYGYTAFDHLADEDDWKAIQSAGNYHWFLDYYLDTMKKASDESGTRLLDVLDVHYYSESARNDAVDRVQSVRTLYEEGFSENSWIGQWCMENVPILPTIQKSIDTYFPGTKLAISEYDYGGNDVSGTIAQAETLGCFADANVYFASLWGGNAYTRAGIKLYTNYDGNMGHFGDTLVPTKTEDVSLASSYAAINGADDGTVTAMLTNKDFTKSENAVIELKGSKSKYQAAAVYAVAGNSSDIHLIDIVKDVKDNKVNVTIPALSAAMIVITDDASDFADLEIYDPTAIREESVVFEDIADRMGVNADGKEILTIPVKDAEHLAQVIVTADVKSSLGSSWGTAGCAICINANDKDGEYFWTYKDLNIPLGVGKEVKVDFDGYFNKSIDETTKEKVEGVICDGKIEFQKWWDSAEKEDDEITIEYKKIEMIYKYDNKGGDDPDPTTQPTTAPSGKYLAGDANIDGEVTVADAAAILQYLGNSEQFPLTDAGLVNADVDGVKGITPSDALVIQKAAAGLIKVDSLPLEES